MVTLGVGAGVFNILFQIGSERIFTIYFFESDGVTQIDISSWTLEFIVRRFKGDRVKTISLTVLNGGITYPVYETNQIETNFTTTDTNISEGEYVWELRRTDENLPILNGLCFFSFNAPQGNAFFSTSNQVTMNGQSITVLVENAGSSTVAEHFRGDFVQSIAEAIPTTDGSGSGGAIVFGDYWISLLGGTWNGLPYSPGTKIEALEDNPTTVNDFKIY